MYSVVVLVVLFVVVVLFVDVLVVGGVFVVPSINLEIILPICLYLNVNILYKMRIYDYLLASWCKADIIYSNIRLPRPAYSSLYDHLELLRTLQLYILSEPLVSIRPVLPTNLLDRCQGPIRQPAAVYRCSWCMIPGTTHQV